MKFFARLFGTKPPNRYLPESTNPCIQSVSTRTEALSFSSDSSYFSNLDILDGMEFNATLQIRTPLDVLIHHGEIYQGPPSQAPRYGEWKDGVSPDGIWVFKTKSWEEMAKEGGGDYKFAKTFDKTGGGTRASDIGPVCSNDYLPFLIEFRKIVESPLPIKNQIKAIKALKFVSIQSASILGKLAKFYPPFPDSYFIGQLCKIPSVGPKTATALFQAGYLSINHLKAMPTERLTSIIGIGPNTAKGILAFANAYMAPERPKLLLNPDPT